MREKYRKIYVISFCFILFFLFISVLARGINRGVLKNESVDEASINWEEIFPFADELIEGDASDNGDKNVLVKDRIIRTSNRIKSTLEWYTTDGFFGQQECIEIVAKMNRIVGNNYIKNKRVVANLEEGYLITMHEQVETKAYANNVIGLSQYLENKDIPFLYVESLYKVERSEQNPLCYDDYCNKNADELLGYLENSGIKLLDLRDCIRAEQEYSTLFFKTDTHWKPETGVWATRVIMEKMNEINPGMVNIRDFDNVDFEEVTYEDRFLGGLGRTVGMGYSKPEDFTLVWPRLDNNFHYIAPTININAQGKFEDVLIDWSQFEQEGYYNNSVYESYMYNRQHYAEIINLDSNNESTVLFLSDSFGITVAPFLSLGIKRIIFIDPRLFNGSVENVIEQILPDMVVAMYNPEVINTVSPQSNDSMYMLK